MNTLRDAVSTGGGHTCLHAADAKRPDGVSVLLRLRLAITGFGRDRPRWACSIERRRGRDSC
jgi:hypothetical protein